MYNKLRGLIREQGLNEKDLADYLSISKSALSCRLNGKSHWNIKEVEKTCEVLNIPQNQIAEYFFKQ